MSPPGWMLMEWWHPGTWHFFCVVKRDPLLQSADLWALPCHLPMSFQSQTGRKKRAWGWSRVASLYSDICVGNSAPLPSSAVEKPDCGRRGGDGLVGILSPQCCVWELLQGNQCVCPTWVGGQSAHCSARTALFIMSPLSVSPAPGFRH